MNEISPTIPLFLGIIAGLLFLGIFITAAIITMRNRRIIRRFSKKSSSDPGKHLVHPLRSN